VVGRSSFVVKALPRILWLLLCLLLIAKGSMAAVLSVTGASGYTQPPANRCQFVELVFFAGSHDEDAVQLSDEQPARHASADGALPPHHQHTCHGLCLMQAVATAKMAMPASCRTSAPVSSLPAFSSVVSSPLVHPPRARG
jgi:hypothetical protein